LSHLTERSATVDPQSADAERVHIAARASRDHDGDGATPRCFSISPMPA